MTRVVKIWSEPRARDWPIQSEEEAAAAWVWLCTRRVDQHITQPRPADPTSR